ncbi:hypothetical protein BDK51DRAFT_26259 [Blyttiomyces helicus]|uniref:Uncharacterized protein n=1 Tax=Blyttiomyces helicus TaxID=388810 RepID=A0A4P9W7C6_9FUNG|nr:hypothetical protein BDK51DRAFT_26259 [Blyttiomyces helicus]|eukprot:RKO86670.1 hypothetical protein BDK51DRAFT_26259 [Blyttiomyces helicus]
MKAALRGVAGGGGEGAKDLRRRGSGDGFAREPGRAWQLDGKLLADCPGKGGEEARGGSYTPLIFGTPFASLCGKFQHSGGAKKQRSREWEGDRQGKGCRCEDGEHSSGVAQLTAEQTGSYTANGNLERERCSQSEEEGEEREPEESTEQRTEAAQWTAEHPEEGEQQASVASKGGDSSWAKHPVRLASRADQPEQRKAARAASQSSQLEKPAQTVQPQHQKLPGIEQPEHPIQSCRGSLRSSVPSRGGRLGQVERLKALEVGKGQEDFDGMGWARTGQPESALKVIQAKRVPGAPALACTVSARPFFKKSVATAVKIGDKTQKEADNWRVVVQSLAWSVVDWQGGEGSSRKPQGFLIEFGRGKLKYQVVRYMF